MKPTNKIQHLLFAAATLLTVCSTSAFATVYEFNDMNSFKTAYNSAQAGDTIRMTADTTVQQLNTTGAISDGNPIYKQVIIDLNGYTLYNYIWLGRYDAWWLCFCYQRDTTS